MLNAIIVDDEQPNRQLLANLLKKHCPDVSIIAEADSVQSAYEQIVLKKPQLVFLDIQMPTGNGFQLLEKLNDIFFDIIFVTSFDQYAINAIKFSALDYLLKPIATDELKAAVDKALIKAEKENKIKLYENLLNNIDPLSTNKRMAVRVNKNTLFISMKDICYVQADGNYCNIFLNDGTKHYIAKTLKEIDEFSNQINGFIRINKSVIINCFWCTHYERKDDTYVVHLKNEKNFEISRRKKQDVLEKINSFMKK